MVKGFSKMYNLSFFGQIFFCKHFYYKTGFCDKKFNFRKFAKFVIFGHKTWDLEGGGQIDPPSAYPGFQVPQQG